MLLDEAYSQALEMVTFSALGIHVNVQPAHADGRRAKSPLIALGKTLAFAVRKGPPPLKRRETWKDDELWG
jgi:hypothetical protein